MPDFNLLDELRHTGYGIASGLDALVGFYNKTLQGLIQRSPILSPSALGVCILNTKTREITRALPAKLHPALVHAGPVWRLRKHGSGAGRAPPCSTLMFATKL